MRQPSTSFDVSEAYASYLLGDPNGGPSCAAIKALTEHIKLSSASTMMGLHESLRYAGETLSKRPDAPMSIASLCELFVRFVTRTSRSKVEASDFETLKRLLVERGEQLAKTTLEARSKIARSGAAFVEAGGTVLTLGYSRDLLMVHQKALPPAMCRADWRPPEGV